LIEAAGAAVTREQNIRERCRNEVPGEYVLVSVADQSHAQTENGRNYLLHGIEIDNFARRSVACVADFHLEDRV